MSSISPRNKIVKSAKFALKAKALCPCRSVSLLANDYLGNSPVGVVFASVVDLIALDEHDDIGVLLNGTGFAQV